MIRTGIYLTSFITIILVTIFSESSSETIRFDVVRDDKSVGEFLATKTYHDDLITYKTSANIITHFILDIPVLYHIEVTMKKDQMITATSIIEINGKTRSQTIIKWTGNEYQIKRRKEREKMVADPIGFPAILLLFQEPVGVKSTFSEESGDLHSLYYMGNHAYKKVDSKGKKNWYYYQKGKLQSASIDAGLIEFEIILKQ